MKFTKQRLQQMIKEELKNVINGQSKKQEKTEKKND